MVLKFLCFKNYSVGYYQITKFPAVTVVVKSCKMRFLTSFSKQTGSNPSNLTHPNLTSPKSLCLKNFVKFWLILKTLLQFLLHLYYEHILNVFNDSVSTKMTDRLLGTCSRVKNFGFYYEFWLIHQIAIVPPGIQILNWWSLLNENLNLPNWFILLNQQSKSIIWPFLQSSGPGGFLTRPLAGWFWTQDGSAKKPFLVVEGFPNEL